MATFQIVSNLGLFNTRWSAIALFLGTDIIAIYIFIQFLRSIPKDLDEAAIIDGASYFTIYWRVILPLLTPAIVTVIIIKGVAIYNEFYIPFLYMPKQALGVISTALFRFKGPYGSQWEVISAGIMIAIIPTLLVFLALAKIHLQRPDAGLGQITREPARRGSQRTIPARVSSLTARQVQRYDRTCRALYSTDHKNLHHVPLRFQLPVDVLHAARPAAAAAR